MVSPLADFIPGPLHKGLNHPNPSLKRGALLPNTKIVEDLVEEGFAGDAVEVFEGTIEVDGDQVNPSSQFFCVKK